MSPPNLLFVFVLVAHGATCTHMPLLRATARFPPIYAISDLHTDRTENAAWLRSGLPWPEDAGAACAVVAGDVSHDLCVLDETLRTLMSRFARVFFVPGNHELWCSTDVQPYIGDSLTKCEAVHELCSRLGVETEPAMVGCVLVVPLLSWYDRSLALPPSATGDAAPLPLRLWADYARCRWPSWLTPPADASSRDARDNGIAAHFASLNVPRLAAAQRLLAAQGDAVRGVLSVSHFLPARCCLPDWCEPAATEFDLNWIAHGAARKASLFASVAGSDRIDAQLRSILPPSADRGKAGTVHVHVFGHSHRPKDFTLRGVRFVHNPVGKGTERQWGVLPEQPGFVRLWDEEGQPVPAARTVIRYWKEIGKVAPRSAQ